MTIPRVCSGNPRFGRFFENTRGLLSNPKKSQGLGSQGIYNYSKSAFATTTHTHQPCYSLWLMFPKLTCFRHVLLFGLILVLVVVPRCISSANSSKHADCCSALLEANQGFNARIQSPQNCFPIFMTSMKTLSCQVPTELTQPIDPSGPLRTPLDPLPGTHSGPLQDPPPPRPRRKWAPAGPDPIRG